MKNIIIVTGGAGFIGSNLIKYLLKKTNFKIISIDNYSTGTIKNHVNHKDVKYIKDENINISKILNSYKKRIKAIYHFGEFSRIYQSFLMTKKCLYSNIYNSFEVINFAKDNKIKIIYSATSSNLGNKGKDENLNSPGMHFAPVAFDTSCLMPDQGRPCHDKANRFYAYGVIARLSMLAAAKELAEK